MKKIMVKLKSKFQCKIFQRVIQKYKGSINASKILKVNASTIRGYKNLYFNSVPKKLIKDLIKLKILSEKELEINLLSQFSNEDQIKKSLLSGREKRKKYFINLKNDIPLFSKIIKTDFLDLSLWFSKYKYLVNSNFRKLQINEETNNFLISYSNFTKNGYKKFLVKLPKKIFLTEDFYYFFGLWCGDRTGGKRFGVANKNPEILKFVTQYLKENYQNIERILVIKEGFPEPPIKYDKKYSLKNSHNGWVLSIHSNNGIFASFFYYLQSNLNEFLNICNNKGAFFAGLFDAEGNVSLYNKSFRWACKNKELIKIYTKYLKEMGLYNKYDGNCLITYDLERFIKLIVPYMKHKDKINNSNFLFSGKPPLPKGYNEILDFIKNNSKKNAKEIAKALNKNKLYSELKLLSDFHFIRHEGYPYGYEVCNSLGA